LARLPTGQQVSDVGKLAHVDPTDRVLKSLGAGYDLWLTAGQLG